MANRILNAIQSVALFTLALLSGGCAPLDVESPTETPIQSIVGFTSQRSLDEHFNKHGREVGAKSKQDYLAMAQALRDAPKSSQILEGVRRDRVITRFSRSTGGFVAYNQDRTIRTYFHPIDRERYFNRQLRR